MCLWGRNNSLNSLEKSLAYSSQYNIFESLFLLFPTGKQSLLLLVNTFCSYLHTGTWKLKSWFRTNHLYYPTYTISHFDLYLLHFLPTMITLNFFELLTILIQNCHLKMISSSVPQGNSILVTNCICKVTHNLFPTFSPTW